MFEPLGAHYDELKMFNLIVDRNERRRDLNPGQKAMVALALEPMFAAAAKAEEVARKASTVGDLNSRNAHSLPTRTGADLHQSPASKPSAYERKAATRAAAAVGASGRAVAQAKAVQREAGEWVEPEAPRARFAIHMCTCHHVDMKRSNVRSIEVRRRLTVYLDDDALHRLKLLAALDRVSLTELVGDLVEAHIQENGERLARAHGETA